MEKIINALARELNIKPKQAEATVQLLDEGNTVPFIARYRKEATGSLDEEQIRTIEERLAYLRNLEQRRQEILTAIAAQEKLTPELEAAINSAEKMQALEDLYLPYRPKRRTRAQIARENGLEPLAQLIEEQGKPLISLEQLAAMHIDEEKGIATAEDAWQGAQDIVAENISDSADVRKLLRRELWNAGELVSELIIDEKDAPEFLQYREYSEPVRQLPPHRILAMNRGEDKKALKINLRCPDEKLIAKVAQKLKLNEQSPFYNYYHEALTDSYKRLLLPSLERELRNELTEKAEKQAISVFAANLRQLLLTQPISGHTVLGLDPGYRTGCKTAVIDANGRILATTAMYITGSKHQQEQAEKQFVELMRKFKITLIAIGNGTASYETEQFTSQMLEKYSFDAAYIIVSEAGASVYSASKLAREELPDLDVSLRGAVSIARRVQDP
ncbi:MAG: RNA-binding transcriptional accessory protein, partial [Phascolarctobacterium sp.]|nr:RNA-binding transcriptional accessory protein [Phascolarctobacterium sp.]